ncbi:GGDEF domain-containing protein [Neoaquamicrobium microcysteis]|uniref:GGDEF domain-containing protein n=1 Tax=Neoaquamicrobium microcysteis TaxID=2682781 RepID=UPI001F3D8D9B|nr:diguanylate cyclase [Mesorhizobium microcysteis]
MASLLLVVLAIVSAGSADTAGSRDIQSSCWASGSIAEDVVATARSAQQWSCSDRAVSIEAERVLLLFDIGPDDILPRYFLSRRSALGALHMLAIDSDGAVRSVSMPAGDLSSSMLGGYFEAPLPGVTHETRQVIVAIDLPSHKMTLERAYLAPLGAADASGYMRYLLVLAGLTGMLVMPLIFNAAFYRILREPFVLWHSALTLSLLATILASSGLSVVFFEPRAMTLSWITTLVFGATIASGLMFTHSFIEPGLMHPLLRRLLPYCAVLALLLSTFHAAFPFVMRPIQSSVYTAAFAPILLIFLMAAVDGLRRGSIAARFQAAGYAPMILVGLIRLGTGVVPWLDSADAMLMFYVGCACEVFFTTLGVADRLMTIRRERDRAIDQADVLERLSETDPLTGLLNRRAMEGQFGQLRAEGFDTLAVVDLDHFKLINDTSGHSVGDAVLQAVAKGLQPSSNVRAYRLGGEEFMLLIRGGDAVLQAERRRKSISTIVAHEVPGLQRPVTASMGIAICHGVEDFDAVYDRADKLLYEAKSAGRNRTRSDVRSAAAVEAGAA